MTFPKWALAVADLFLRGAHGECHAGARIATTPLRGGGRRAWLIGRWRDGAEKNTGLYGDGPTPRAAAAALAAGLVLAMYRRDARLEGWDPDEPRPRAACNRCDASCAAGASA